VTVSRRDALKLAAAAAASPLLPGGTTAAAAPLARPAAGRFFSAPEMALLDELVEMIIPADEHSGGARAAGVAAYIDGRLADYDPEILPLREEREKWKGGLAVMDALARTASGKSFIDSPPAERLALLERLAKAKAEEDEDEDERPTEEPKDRGRPAEEKPEALGRRFFVQLKSWTARGYYTSKIGLHDEMEYKGNTLQVEFSGTDVATLPALRLPED
jgi:hypothetical protein